MKKTVHLMLLLGLAGMLAANAQTETNVTSQPAETSTNVPPVTEGAAVAAGTEMATPSVEATPTPAATNEMAAPAAMAEKPAAEATNPPALSAETTNAPAQSPAAESAGNTAEPAATSATAGTNSIPLIQFTDLEITAAIENLARQAGINYMLDPKIGYGQPDANGQIKVEPKLSIRWENISAESALLALLDNYGLQLMHDKHTGIDRITVKDPAAPPPLITRVVQLQYASVAGMVENIQSALTDKRSKVMADTRTSQLVVVATDPEQTAVDTLVKQLDRPTKQVLIETKLVEISSQPSTKKGVDWSPTLSAQSIKFGNGSIVSDVSHSSTTVNTPGTSSSGSTTTTPGGGYSTSTTPSSSASTLLTLLQGSGGLSASTLSGLIPATAFLNADGLQVVLSFLNQQYDAQVMSTPQIVTLDNETADIAVTRQYPVINFGGGTQQSSGSSSVTYSNVGTILHVTPRISANDKIALKVIPEVSSHFGDQSVTVPGGAGNPSFTFTVPIFDSRKLSTQVLIPNGNTLVMGGLVQDNPTASYTKVPLLGDIPGLGWAFRSETKSINKDTLVIFITPTIVQDSDFTPHKTDFLQSQPRSMKEPLNPNTMWDSAPARGNWSNPAPVSGEFDTNDKLNNF